MAISKSVITVSIVSLLSLIVLGGCEPKGGEKVKAVGSENAAMALGFIAGDTSTYKSVVNDGRSAEFQGEMTKDPNIKGGYTGTRIEMTFTQQIQSVTDAGNGVAQITIDGLKVLAQTKSVTSIDFDSTREADKANPLFGLIGKSYTIELTPDGKVAKVVDASGAIAAISGEGQEKRFGAKLLSNDLIEERHSIAALNTAGTTPLKSNATWSLKKQENFGMMGVKDYEKVYTVTSLKTENGSTKAVVTMNAIPAANAQAKGEPESPFSKMVDNKESYTGSLAMDVSSGKVDRYDERLNASWTIVDPQASSSAEPNIIIMSETREVSLEKIK